MIEYLAFVAQFLFVGATIAQVIKAWQDGHADGISHFLIWMLFAGFGIMLYYTVYRLNSDPVLITGYVGQLIGFLIIARYKYFRRK